MFAVQPPRGRVHVIYKKIGEKEGEEKCRLGGL